MIKYSDFLKKAGGFFPVHKDINYTVGFNEIVFLDTTSGALQITPPATPLDGQRFRVVDAQRQFNTNKCTIIYDGSIPINGGTSNIDITTQGAIVELVYDGTANKWTLILIASSVGGGGGSGVGDIFLMPNQCTFDADMLGVDSGLAFGFIECLDFRYDVDGRVTFVFPFPVGWTNTKDINFRMTYNLNGVDNGKVVRTVADIWSVDDGATPNMASPTVTLTEDITSSADNTNVDKAYAFTTIKVPLANLSLTTKNIIFSFYRKASDAADTYGGTLQVIQFIAYQA